MTRLKCCAPVRRRWGSKRFTALPVRDLSAAAAGTLELQRPPRRLRGPFCFPACQWAARGSRA